MEERDIRATEPEETSPALSLVSWNVTCRCNLRCGHCYLSAGEDSSHQDLTLHEGLALIRQLAELAPGAMLVLSGGEPLLRPDLLSLAEYASLRGLVVVLGSNGMHLDLAMARELKERGVQAIGVSLDSPEPFYHDSFRGVAGAWKGALRGIEACRRSGLEFQLHTTLTRGNYHLLPELMGLARDLGAKAFNLFFLVCTGRGQEMTDISPHQYEEALSLVAESQGSYQPVMIRARCAPHFLRVARQKGVRAEGLDYMAGCLAASHYCRITCQGEVTPCPYLPLSAGTLRSQSLAEVWHSSPLLQAMRSPRVAGKCGWCDFGTWCQGCRARAYTTGEDLYGEDPWCTYQPPQGSLSDGRTGDLRPRWTPEARERMDKAPAFIRPTIRSMVERYASERGIDIIAVEVLDEVKGLIRNR